MQKLKEVSLHLEHNWCSEMAFKVPLRRKSHLFYWSHFKTQTSSLREKKNAVYYFQISLFDREIFKFLKYANKPIDDVIYSTKFWSNMMKKDISANLYQKCLILCRKILLNVLHYLSLNILLSWQHTGFQTSPKLKTFLAPLAVEFSYLQMVPDIHDPTSI